MREMEVTEDTIYEAVLASANTEGLDQEQASRIGNASVHHILELLRGVTAYQMVEGIFPAENENDDHGR